ncbi:MAG: phosphoethanolamine--lipid A transferase EptA [Candidatus Thiodiazotropha sp.]
MRKDRLPLLKPLGGANGRQTADAKPGSSGSLIGLLLMLSLFNLALYHWPLFRFAFDNLEAINLDTVLILITVSVVIVVVTLILLSLLLLISQRLLKPVGIIMLIGNSVALYFIKTYQVVLDKTMMSNVMNTDVNEASSFFHPMLLVYIVIFGLIPSAVLLFRRYRRTTRLRLAVFAVFSLLLGVGWVYANASTWLWIDKNAKKLGGMILPWSYVINSIRYQTKLLANSREQTPLPPATIDSDSRTVVVLVIGESARAANFSLYGYPRPTNPLLSRDGAVAMQNTQACSTYTTASVSCILSHDNHDTLFSGHYEPLPSYLQRSGADVIWRSRNWGEPPLKVATYERDSEIKERCKGQPGCEGDEVLLSGLAERIQSSQANKIFVVLHQKGSHGPDYHTKYPDRFEVFKPVCETVELSKCSNEELVNAYDNTIVYTDYVLHRLIELLKGLDGTAAVMLYISDHGESLGEHGLYLHGTPYTIAPDVQKQVPFIVWMSEGFANARGLSSAALGQQAEHSQDNIFHSVLGALDVRSSVYDGSLDIFNIQAGKP